MKPIIIIKWALNSYLKLKEDNCFNKEEFKTIIRTDVLRLKNFPNDNKFVSQQFWCPVKISGNTILK